MRRRFDLVVIGTGAASYAPVTRCREAGWEVAVIDGLPFGGTCALRGCDPKKVLVGAAALADWVRRMHGRDVLSGECRIDWAGLMRFKSGFTDPVPESKEKSYAEQGVAAFHGTARFLDRSRLVVNGETIEARRFVIASGARPMTLGIPGEEFLHTSTNFLNLPSLPPRVAFVGGGYISFEFAHVAARAGASVTILHRGERPLPKFDPDLTGQLVEATRRLGVDVRLRSPVEAIERRGDSFVIHAAGEVEADLVVHGAGRAPNLDDLNLAVAGVEAGRRGVLVNEHLRSVSNPDFYAAVDAAASPGPPLTPVAAIEGRTVAANLLEGDLKTPDYTAVPSVVFTVPPLAAVGMSEAEAREKQLEVEVHSGDSTSWYTSRRIAEEVSGYKVLVEKGSGRLLGAHLLGEHSEELINLFALAIRHGIPAAELKRTIYAYPTRAGDISYMV
ncbi:MAG: dihydrolipoyl dehydrogenase family protein [Bryobacteraceae bacterium]